MNAIELDTIECRHHCSPSTANNPTASGSFSLSCAQPSSSSIEPSRRRRRCMPDTKAGEKWLGKWNPSMTLENSGSVARDHLASERTFLAYVRTSLTIASTGVALVQLFTIAGATSNKAILQYARPLGAVIIIIGLSTLVLGAVRYFAIQKALLKGMYPVARVSTMLMAAALSTVTVVVFGVILGVRH